MRTTLLLGLLLAGDPVCNIPVFRYALERWPAAAYPAAVFHRGAPPKVTLEDGALNIAVDLVDVDRPMKEEHRKLWEKLKAPSLPWLGLLFPGDEEHLAWSGPYDTFPGLIDSPARLALVSSLMRGTACVWLLLESGNAAADVKATALLERQLPLLEKSLKIPVLGPEDPPLRSELPLVVSFSILKIAPNDPAEAAFVETLRRGWADLELPAVFPVFGRGRTLGPLRASEIRADAVEELARYITDACSCEVKEFNPGIDLLISAEWDKLLELGPTPLPEPLPAVVIPPGQRKSAAPAPATRRPAFLGGLAAAVFGTLALLFYLVQRGKA